MKKELCLFMIAALAISMFAVLPMPVLADDSFEYDPSPPTKVWEGILKPGESTPWITVKVKATGPYTYPVYQKDGWTVSTDPNTNIPSWWFIVDVNPGPTYIWESAPAVVTVDIKITIHPNAGETDCYTSFTVKLKPGYDSSVHPITGRPNPKTVGSGSGVLFNICIKKPVEKYYLTVQTNPPGIVPIAGEGWYNKCTTVTLTAPEIVEVSEGFRYRFDYWDVDGIPVAGNPITVHMDKDHVATANYVAQYYLTVKVDPEGLVEIPGEGWYDNCTEVDLEAPPVEGWLFVYWDVDGTPVEGNPITVHMDAPHTATAHYWPELEYEQFVTDSDFNVIERFDTVWTPKDQRKTMFKLASTNPGQFMLNIVIKNTWDVAIDKIVISFTIDPLFELKGADPIQVHTGYGKTGTRVYAELGPGIITPPNTPPDLAPKMITIYNIEPGMTLYITIHLEYGPAREYFPKETMLNWKELYPSNTFLCGFTVEVPGPFPFEITRETSTTIHDPIIVLGVED